jgi:hypothetical protein
MEPAAAAEQQQQPAAQPARRVVKPRSDRYCLSEREQHSYTAFVEMLSQLDKGARLQLAEAAVKEAAQQAPGGAGGAPAPQ